MLLVTQSFYVYVQSEITSIEVELLHKFVPDDVCRMGYGSEDTLQNKGRPKDEVNAFKYFLFLIIISVGSFTYADV